MTIAASSYQDRKRRNRDSQIEIRMEVRPHPNGTVDLQELTIFGRTKRLVSVTGLLKDSKPRASPPLKIANCCTSVSDGRPSYIAGTPTGVQYLSTENRWRLACRNAKQMQSQDKRITI